MKRIKPLLFITTLLFFTAINAQHTSDTKSNLTSADDLLLRVDSLFSFSQYQQALKVAQEAEHLLRLQYDDLDPRMAKVYSIAGLAALQADRPAADEYLKKVQAIEPLAQNMERIPILYFRGMGAVFESNPGKALDLFSDALNIWRQVNGPESMAAPIHNSTGFVFLRQGRYREAIAQIDTAIRIWSALHGPDYPRLAHCYNNSGMAWHRLGYPREALHLHKNALSIRTHTLPPHHPEIAASAINIGLIQVETGDCDYAIEYFFKALDIIQRAGITQYLPVAFTNIGVAYSCKQEYFTAQKYYRQALEIEQTLYPPDDPELAVTVFNIAVAFKDERRFEEAAEYYQKAISMSNTEHPNIAQFYSGLGLTHFKSGRYEQAEKNYLKSLELALSKYDSIHPQVINIYHNLAELEAARSNFTKAINWSEKAAEHLGYRGGRSTENIPFPNELYVVLSQKCRILWQQAQYKPELHLITQLHEQCDIALNISDQLSRSYRNASARLALMERTFSTFEIAIAAHLVQVSMGNKPTETEKESAFQLSERSKAVLLYEAMEESKIQRIAGIPENLLQSEYDIKMELASCHTKRSQYLAEGLSETDAAALELSYRIEALQNRYDTLKNILRLEYPKYFEAKYHPPTISAKEVQRSLLRPGQTLLEYVAGDSNIFIFVLQPDRLEVRQIKKDFPLEQWVQDMTRHGIYGYYTLPKGERSSAIEEQTRNNYIRAARQLYEKLVAPVADLLTQELIIIPDGVLGYLPFEALLKTEPLKASNFTTYPFLLYDYQISYCYSATLLREMRQKQHLQMPGASLLAMAPFFRGNAAVLNDSLDSLDLTLRDALEPLPASGPEAAAAARLWKGLPLYADEATIERFRREAERYRILHLSTHGQADDRMGDYAFLAFSEPGSDSSFARFYARDLYNMELNADLVVLSACETGIGKLRRGEGIVSIARAFAYAGAKSIVTTLWKVNDERTQNLMLRFYRNLRTGDAKDAALQRAKRDYLNANRKQGTTGMHPFFWAGLIIIGDMEKL